MFCLDSVTTNLPAECKGDSGGLCVEEFCGKTNPDQKTWNLNLDNPTNGNDIAKKFLNNKSKFCSSSWKARERNRHIWERTCNNLQGGSESEIGGDAGVLPSNDNGHYGLIHYLKIVDSVYEELDKAFEGITRNWKEILPQMYANESLIIEIDNVTLHDYHGGEDKTINFYGHTMEWNNKDDELVVKISSIFKIDDDGDNTITVDDLKNIAKEIHEILTQKGIDLQQQRAITSTCGGDLYRRRITSRIQNKSQL